MKLSYYLEQLREQYKDTNMLIKYAEFWGKAGEKNQELTFAMLMLQDYEHGLVPDQEILITLATQKRLINLIDNCVPRREEAHRYPEWLKHNS